VNGTRDELQLNSNLGAHANLSLGDALEVKSFQISPTFHIPCHVYYWMAHLHFLSCQWSVNDTAKGKWAIQNYVLRNSFENSWQFDVVSADLNFVSNEVGFHSNQCRCTLTWVTKSRPNFAKHFRMFKSPLIHLDVESGLFSLKKIYFRNTVSHTFSTSAVL